MQTFLEEKVRRTGQETEKKDKTERELQGRVMDGSCQVKNFSRAPSTGMRRQVAPDFERGGKMHAVDRGNWVT